MIDLFFLLLWFKMISKNTNIICVSIFGLVKKNNRSPWKFEETGQFQIVLVSHCLKYVKAQIGQFE